MSGLAASEPTDRVFAFSDMAMLECLRGHDPGATTHGIWSSFRDWAGDETSSPRDLAEAALAHTVENKVEAAYRRGDALRRRRELMDEWATYLAGDHGKVVALAGKRRDVPK